MATAGADRVRSPRTLAQVCAYRRKPVLTADSGERAGAGRGAGADTAPAAAGILWSARAGVESTAIGRGAEAGAAGSVDGETGGDGAEATRSAPAGLRRASSPTITSASTAPPTAISPRLAPNERGGEGLMIGRGGN